MKSFDEIAKKKANGGTLTPLETMSLEGTCIDSQKRLNAFNRAIDDADRELQALTATISAQRARIAELEELLSQARGDLSCYPGTRGIISDINELLGDES